MNRIGPMTDQDLEEALPLLAGYQRFYGVAQPDDERNLRFFRRFLDPSEDGLLLGVWDGSELVGFACLYWTFSSVHASEIVLLSDLFVRQEQRGKGLGRSLIQASAEVARRRGAHHLEWLTASDNIAAQQLYDTVGASKSPWLGYEIHTGGPEP